MSCTRVQRDTPSHSRNSTQVSRRALLFCCGGLWDKGWFWLLRKNEFAKANGRLCDPKVTSVWNCQSTTRLFFLLGNFAMILFTMTSCHLPTKNIGINKETQKRGHISKCIHIYVNVFRDTDKTFEMRVTKCSSVTRVNQSREWRMHLRVSCNIRVIWSGYFRSSCHRIRAHLSKGDRDTEGFITHS